MTGEPVTLTDHETIELLRSQIRYQQAEIQRLKLIVGRDAIIDDNALVTHEWRVVATNHAWGCETYTDAEETRKLVARKCPPDIHPTIQHRLVTAWKDIQ